MRHEPLLTKETPLEYVEKLGHDCERCGHCCSFGSGYFLDSDLPRIADHLGITIEQLKEKCLDEVTAFNTKIHKAKTIKEKGKAYGACTFFNKQEGCIIHDIKPLHCRISKGCGEYGEQISCWFSLNYLVHPEDPQSIREWASFLLTSPTIPGGDTEELVKDKKLLKKIMTHEVLK